MILDIYEQCQYKCRSLTRGTKKIVTGGYIISQTVSQNN